MTVTQRGRVVALDPGTRRVGVAVSDSSRTMAFPRGSVTVGDPARLVEDLLVLINEEDASCVVIGLPKNLDGREGQSAKDSRRLAEELAKRLSDSDVMVVLHDERLTTVQASQSLHAAGRSSRDQRAVIDSAAATVLLEAWMQCQ